MTVTLRVNNLQIVTRALQQVDSQVRRDMTKELHDIGSLVAGDAQSLAVATIPNLSRSPSWSLMRVGQTPSSIYVVPRNKGVRGKGPRRRPNFSQLMLTRSMRPALQRRQAEVDSRFETVISVVCGKFSAGG